MAAETETLRALIDAFRPPDCPVTVDAATRRAAEFLTAFSLGVNPQWTVMAMADLAAGHVGTD